jgi:hypothetical protein
MALPSGVYEIGLPGDASLYIRQGDSWRTVFTITVNGVAADLSSGVTATLLIKDAIGGSLVATATCTIPVGTDGKVLATMTPATTAAIATVGTTRLRLLGVWDLNLTDTTNTATPVGGDAWLYQEVTKP